jgi:NADH-quinone oxidoreductase subunit A
VVFLVALGAAAAVYRLMGTLSLRSAKTPSGGRTKAYACGEDVPEHHVQPDYAQFFPFAFFFTIMHVFALIVATVPGGSLSAAAVAVGYTAAAVIALFILFRE